MNHNRGEASMEANKYAFIHSSNGLPTCPECYPYCPFSAHALRRYVSSLREPYRYRPNGLYSWPITAVVPLEKFYKPLRIILPSPVLTTAHKFVLSGIVAQR